MAFWQQSIRKVKGTSHDATGSIPEQSWKAGLIKDMMGNACKEEKRSGKPSDDEH